MPLRALLLVCIAALAHSTWNLLAKRASEKTHLIWFSSLGETIPFLPLAIWILKRSQSKFSLMALVFLLATGILHVFYTDSLQHAYRVGDLSVVYPLARGAAPLLSFWHRPSARNVDDCWRLFRSEAVTRKLWSSSNDRNDFNRVRGVNADVGLMGGRGWYLKSNSCRTVILGTQPGLC